MPMFKLFGPAQKPAKYNSVGTRYTSMQPFLGGAEFNEVHDKPGPSPVAPPENLVRKFRSGVYASDCPSMNGHPNVIRKIAGVTMSLGQEVQSWRRNRGEAP